MKNLVRDLKLSKMFTILAKPNDRLWQGETKNLFILFLKKQEKPCLIMI